MTPQEFIAAIGPAAQASAKKTGIYASFTVADAALESGWGNHCPGHNLFGVKAGVEWKGATTGQTTREQRKDGSWYTVTASFRAYPDWQGSIDDHANFLLSNPRYARALKCIDVESFTRAVAYAGYATDLAYAQHVLSIIEAHNLKELDTV